MLFSNQLNLSILFNIRFVKMARRIDKLLDRKSRTITPHITDFYNDVIREARDTIQVIRHKIDAQIQAIQREDDEFARLPPLNDLDLEEDSHQKMPTLNEYLRQRVEMSTQSDLNHEGTREVKSYRRYYKDRSRPPTDMINQIGEIDRSIYWTEFENVALYDMSLRDEQYTEQDLREL